MTTDRPQRPRALGLTVRVACALGFVLVATACSATTTERADASSRGPAQQPGVNVGASSVPPPSSSATSSSSASSTTSTTTATTPPATTPPTTAVVQLTGWDAFDQSLSMVLDGGSVAVSATVLRDGEVEHEVAMGSRTLAGDDPVRAGDRYRIASISKVIAAITVLRLVQGGLVGLDEPVGARLSARVGVASPAAMVDSITVRNLLTHRSGIGQYEDLVFRNEVSSCPEAGAVALTRPLGRAPSTTFRYSNLNFCLLGLLVEDVAGRPYVDVATEQVLTPLGIDGMRFAPTFDAGDDRPVAHRSDPGRNYMEVLGAAGAWIASPTDVAIVINSLDPDTPGWKPLEPWVRDEMKTITLDPPPPFVPDPPVGSIPVATDVAGSTIPALPPVQGYGMGLMIFGPNAYGHTGTLESTHVMTARRPDGITWAVMVSGDYPTSTRELATIIDDALAAGEIVGS